MAAQKEYKSKGFLLYADDEELFEQLTDADKRRVVMALFRYFKRDEIPADLDVMANVVFTVLKRNIDRDREKYRTACERKRESQRRAWQRKNNVNNVDNVNIVDNETKTKTQTKSVLVLDKTKTLDVPPSLDGRRPSNTKRLFDSKKKNEELKNDGFFDMTAAEKVAYLERKRKGL